MGDFNMEWHEPSTQSTMNSVLPGYRQLVTGSTTDYGSLIDHVYTDIPSQFVQCYTTESYFSDHKPVVIAITFTQ